MARTAVSRSHPPGDTRQRLAREPPFASQGRCGRARGQVLTSRNVRGGPVTDFLLGGLNYQIEHHVFPSMPTSALARAQSLVRAQCAELRLPYTETGLVDSYRQALRHLHAVGAPTRTAA